MQYIHTHSKPMVIKYECDFLFNSYNLEGDSRLWVVCPVRVQVQQYRKMRTRSIYGAYASPGTDTLIRKMLT